MADAPSLGMTGSGDAGMPNSSNIVDAPSLGMTGRGEIVDAPSFGMQACQTARARTDKLTDTRPFQNMTVCVAENPVFPNQYVASQ